MALPTPEEQEGVIITPEQPAQPEAAPPVPEAQPPTEAEPAPAPTPELPASEAPSSSEVSPAVPAELAPQVQELVDVAFDRGVTAAIEQARKTGSAALIDALHATLKEPEMREALESRGKLKPAA